MRRLLDALFRWMWRLTPIQAESAVRPVNYRVGQEGRFRFGPGHFTCNTCRRPITDAPVIVTENGVRKPYCVRCVPVVYNSDSTGEAREAQS